MQAVAVVLAFLISVIAVGSVARAESPLTNAVETPIVVRFSHVVSEDTAKGVGANLFKERVEERLAGKVRVEVYPRSQKFSDTEVVMAMLFGDVEMAAPSFAKLTPYGNDLLVFDLPFMFPDVDAVHRFQGSEAGQQLLDSMLPVGIRGLAYWDNGMRVISSKRPLHLPSDADGLSFRIEPSRIFHDQYTNLGVVPRAMPFSRLTDAIREDIVTGQENTWSNIFSRGVHRYHKHFTELDHSFLGYMVITNDEFWQGLPTDIRGELEAILAEVSTEVNALAAEQAVAYRQNVVESGGVEIIRPDADQTAEWRKAMCEVWARFTVELDSEVLTAAIAATATGLQTAAGPPDANMEDAAANDSTAGVTITNFTAAAWSNGAPCHTMSP